MAEHDNICKYIHLPIQSGSDRILKLMNRTYTRAHYLSIIEMIRKAEEQTPPPMERSGIGGGRVVTPTSESGWSLSTDIIVGFCTETLEDHEMTKAGNARRGIRWRLHLQLFPSPEYARMEYASRRCSYRRKNAPVAGDHCAAKRDLHASAIRLRLAASTSSSSKAVRKKMQRNGKAAPIRTRWWSSREWMRRWENIASKSYPLE